MRVASGISVLNGIAIGRIRYYKSQEYIVSDHVAEDPFREMERFEKARQRVKEEQNALYESALEKAGEDCAEIFRLHADMLDDGSLLGAVRTGIERAGYTAEYAVSQAFSKVAQKFMDVDDPYFKARSADVLDVGNSVLAFLTDSEDASRQWKEPAILVTEDLSPSETVKLDKTLLLGLITREGSSSSHTAIVARSMNLPTLVQCGEASEDWDGKMAVLDGYNGCVYLEPDDYLLSTMRARRDEDLKKEALLKELKGKSNTTIDGRTVAVYANIGGPDDIEAVLKNDAEGVGLFRSEFVYLDAKEEPTEEEQFEAYRRVLEALSPRRVVIRTFDIGADKTVDYMKLDREENPALGYRAIRICLTRREFFKKQLRALLRASAYGNLGILFPLIISLREIRESKELLEECREELIEEGIPVADQIAVGIMVETPAAALCADELAREVDFFSIGTNDLTQYTCALDRRNARLEPFSDPHHPAVLRLVGMTIEAAHRHGISAGICGELGADPNLTREFLSMGIDEFSVNPASVLPLRKMIRSIDLSGYK